MLHVVIKDDVKTQYLPPSSNSNTEPLSAVTCIERMDNSLEEKTLLISIMILACLLAVRNYLLIFQCEVLACLLLMNR